MRKLIVAKTYEHAADFAKASGWLLNAWKFVRDVHDVIGANAETEVYVLPFAGKGRSFPEILRGLMARGARIHDLTEVVASTPEAPHV